MNTAINDAIITLEPSCKTPSRVSRDSDLSLRFIETSQVGRLEMMLIMVAAAVRDLI